MYIPLRDSTPTHYKTADTDSPHPKTQQRHRQDHLIQAHIPPLSNCKDTGEEPSSLHNHKHTKHTHATRVQNTTLYSDGTTHSKQRRSKCHDLCIAAQEDTFNKVETILTTALTAIGDYYIRNQLRANPDKTQTCAFHLRNREAKTELKVSWDGKKLEHTPTPVYLGVILDRTLSYSSHVAKVKAKTEARNNVLKKLSNTKWGASPSTIKTTALALCYSTAEYACPVWGRSAHAYKVDPALNEACRSITGCLKPTNVENLYLLAGIAPPAIRRHTIAQREREKQIDDDRHPLYGHTPAARRLKSRHSFIHSTEPLVTKPATARVTAWSAHLQTVANKLLDEPKESLASGSTLPWPEWMCLNRLRTGMGRCKHNMRKWGYSEEDTTCECQEAEQTMKHLLECPLLRQTCSNVDLIHYYEPAKECVKQWMGKV